MQLFVLKQALTQTLPFQDDSQHNRQQHEWHNPPVTSGTNTPQLSKVSSAVLHPISSSHLQCQTSKQQKTLCTQSIFQYFTQTVEQSAHYSERA